jgi:hypothetical protein
MKVLVFHGPDGHHPHPHADGQGSWEALFGMAGLIAGSWIFAELSGWTKRTVEKWGDLGKVLLPDLLHVPRDVFVVGFAVTLTALIVLLERFTTR